MSSAQLQNQKYVKVAIIGAIILISSIIVIRFVPDLLEPPEFPGVGKLGTDHQHARFAAFMEDERVSFSPILYTKYREASPYIMLEPNDGNTIHRFATGATLKMFFDSFGMEFTKECFKLDPDDTVNVANKKVFRAEYCNDGDKTMQLYVNNELNDDFENYVVQELDRVLVTYAPSADGKAYGAQRDGIDKQLQLLFRGQGPGLVIGGGGGFAPPPLKLSCGPGTQLIEGMCTIIPVEEPTP